MGTLRVIEAFAVRQGVILRDLPAGLLVDENDPVVTPQRRRFFEPVEVAAARESERIEQATAAPGERRNVTRPAKKAAAKPADKN